MEQPPQKKLTLKDIQNDLRRVGCVARIPSIFLLITLIEEGILEAVKEFRRWVVTETSYTQWKQFLQANQDERTRINQTRHQEGKPPFR